MSTESFAVVPFVLSLGNFLIQGWAAKKVFRKVGNEEPKRFRTLKLVVTMCMIALLAGIALRPTGRLLLVVASAASLIVSSAIFWAAVKAKRDFGLSLAFSDDAPKSLLNTGIYRYVRHPFYSSYIASYIGAGLAIDSPLAFGPAVLMTAWYYFAAGVEERKFSNSDLKSDYSNYRANAGMFLPKPASLFFLGRRGGAQPSQNHRR